MDGVVGEHLSVIADVDGEELGRSRALVGNQVMLLLLDSGSSHSFVNKSFVDRLGLPTHY